MNYSHGIDDRNHRMTLKHFSTLGTLHARDSGTKKMFLIKIFNSLYYLILMTVIALVVVEGMRLSICIKSVFPKMEIGTHASTIYIPTDLHVY